MSKRAKEFKKLLHKKPLSSDEAERLIRLDGWVPDENKPQRGSHKYFVHPTKKGKVTIPAERNCLVKDTRDDILIQAGLLGD